MPEVMLPNPLGETDTLRSYERGEKVASMVGVEESMVIDRERSVSEVSDHATCQCS